MIFKNIARRLLSEPMLGMIDYYRFRERRKAWGGPFNGQSSRQALFCALVDQFAPAAIIETGTYMGTTTEFMASDGLPVYSAEVHPRAFGFARTRFRGMRHVTIRRGDSRKLLCSFLDGPLRSCRERTLFVYLDAHWNADLPLAEEIAIVFSRCPAAIVMIDDFQVPFDAGYGYDDFGAGHALTASYIAPAVAAHHLDVFYPATPSSEESGARRGCVILAKSDVHGGRLATMPLLRKGQTPDSTVRELTSPRHSSTHAGKAPHESGGSKRCPTLAELPAPPPGKIGWPWTEETPQLPDAMPDGSAWPKISIVTPSFNQGEFVEETIRAVLLQGYPNIEYVVMDGGSKDRSVEIIKKYEPWLTYWFSGPDKGHGHALNKGFSRCSGDLFGWINSDDLYFVGAFARLAEAYRTTHGDFFYGDSIMKHVDEKKLFYSIANPVFRRFLTIGGIIYQHSAFWTKALHEPIREDLNCAVDSELWFRLLPKATRVVYVNYPLAAVNSYASTKTGNPKFRDQWEADNSLIGQIHDLRRRGIRKYLLYHNTPLYWPDYRINRFMFSRLRRNARNVELMKRYFPAFQA